VDYEVIVLDNGNYLCVGRKPFSLQDFTDAGYAVGSWNDGVSKGFPDHYDVIVELDRDSGDIVWEWSTMDHVIQERDDTKGNYGVVADHPELFNMDAVAVHDWQSESFMINGFDYNPALDQIILSMRKLSEVVIIDHSTTSAEASGHTGGNAGKGGDILYRWGNPNNYERGVNGSRRLYFQHNPNWIQYGENAGKIIMYNNGLAGPLFSTVPIIDPPKDSQGNYILEDNEPFQPSLPEVEYGDGLGESFFSGYTSAAKILPNGNVLVTVGGSDKVIEMLPDGSLVWEYNLYDSNLTFRVEKYAQDYPAFDGRDLTPGEVVEFPPSSVSCTLLDTATDEYFISTEIWTANSKLKISTDIASKLDLRLYAMEGKLMLQENVIGNVEIDLSNFATGVYIVKLTDPQAGQSQSYKVYR